MHAFTRKTGTKLLMVLALLIVTLAITACNREEAPARAEGVDHDAPPRVLRMVGHYPHTIFGAWPFEEPDWDDVNDIEIAQMMWDNFHRVQEYFNVRLEVHATDDYDTFLEYFMAGQMTGNPVGDVVFLAGSMMGPAMAANQLIDLNTLTFPGSDLHGAQNYITPTVVVDGRIFQVTINNGGSIWSTDGMVVNMDLVNRLGLPNPTELYEAGQWNWDNFLSIMRTAKNQGYFGVAGVIQDLGKGLMGANDGATVTPDLNYGFAQTNTLVSLELMETIIREGLWQYDTEGSDHTDWGRSSNAFNDGRAVFGAVRLWMNWSDIETVAALPFPKGPNNRSGNTWSDGMPAALTIPVGVEDPVLVLRVLEALMAWPGDDYWMLQHANVEEARGHFADEASAQRWAALGGQVNGDPGLDLTDYRYFWGPLFEGLHEGTTTLSEFIESERGSRQEVLDRTFR